MSTDIRWRPVGGVSDEVVNEFNPYPVQVMNTPGQGFRLVTIYLPTLPGEVFADALDAGDAIGTPFPIPGVSAAPGGVFEIVTAHLLDRSDQGAAIQVPLFKEPIAGTANDAAFAPTDGELSTYAGTLAFSSYQNWGGNQVSTVSAVGLYGHTGSTTNLYSQLVTTGTPTLTAFKPYGLIVVVKQYLDPMAMVGT